MSFLSALLSFFAPICLEHSKELQLLVEVCLEKYLFIQRQQANQRKVQYAVILLPTKLILWNRYMYTLTQVKSWSF